jgi:hypothetical protein
MTWRTSRGRSATAWSTGVPVTPEQARRWLEGKKPIAHDMNTGEPSVDDDGWQIEDHENAMESEDDAA